MFQFFTPGALSGISSILSGTWDLFGITIPGTYVTFGGFALGCIGTVVAIKIFTRFFGSGVGFFTSSGGNNRNIKISNNRRGDEK